MDESLNEKMEEILQRNEDIQKRAADLKAALDQKLQQIQQVQQKLHNAGPNPLYGKKIDPEVVAKYRAKWEQRKANMDRLWQESEESRKRRAELRASRKK
jgi:hypothetical protein